MKPLRLSIDGLSCYQQKQEIDFSELDLFAITGPTGAGKSTILDAIVFGLYGQIPRMGKQGLKEMVNLNRDRATVAFDFVITGQLYRITRQIRRKGNPDVRFEQHDGSDFNRTLADSTTAANAEVEHVVGMDAETFQRAVVLPQGQFAKFLSDQPRDRRTTLKKLLRLEILDAMQQKASRTASDAKNDTKNLEQRLTDDFADVDPDKAKALEDELETAQTESEAKSKRLDELKNSHDQLKRLHATTGKLLKAENEQKNLQERQPQHDATVAELVRANAAKQLKPLIDELNKAIEKRAKDKETFDAVDEQFGLADAAFKKAEAALGAAKDKHSRVSQLRVTSDGLTELIHKAQRAAILEKACTDTEEKAKKVQKELNEKTDERDRKQDELTEVNATQERATQERDNCGFDEQIHEQLNRVLETAIQLSTQRENLRKHNREESTAGEVLDKSEVTLKTATKTRKVAEAARADAQREFDDAKAGFKHAQTHDMALTISSKLQTGDPCPVCSGTFTRGPESDGTLLQAKEAFEKAEAKLEERRKAEGEASNAEVAAQSARNAAESTWKGKQKQLAKTKEDVDELTKRIRTALPVPELSQAKHIEEWVRSNWESSKNKEVAFRKAERQFEKTDGERKKLEAEIRGLSGMIEQLNGQVGGLEKEHKSIIGELAPLRELLGDRDPAKEKEKVQEEIASLEGNLKEAQGDREDANNKLQTLKTQREGAKQTFKASEESVVNCESKLTEALAVTDFADIDAAQAALRDDATVERMKCETGNYIEERDRVDLQIELYLEELKDRRVNDKELKLSQSDVDECETEKSDLDKKIYGLTEELKQLRERLEKGKELRGQLRNAKSRYHVYQTLESDLRSDRLQAYMLDETFHELISGGSERLMELSSSRYAMAYRDEKILVLDQDHAGEARLSSTLSGGETFLASLALALELSSQVQRAAGAIQLDSLFIDEGFGTLDPETLSTVSDAIQRLRETGRMVGIISHVDTLKNEFENQIVVSKTSRGSEISRS